MKVSSLGVIRMAATDVPESKSTDHEVEGRQRKFDPYKITIFPST